MKKLITILFLFLNIYTFGQRANTSAGSSGGGSMLYPPGIGIPTVNNGVWGGTIPYFSSSSINYFNQGTGATSTTFWAGDGTWKPLPSFSTNLSFVNNSSPILLNSSTGTGVVFKAGANVTLSKIAGTKDTLVINSTGSGGGGGGTVTSVGLTAPVGFTVANSPITTFGDLVLGYASGYSLPTDALQTNWTSAFNDKINSASFSGTDVKTLTLTQQDGGTITASFNDQSGSGGYNTSMAWNDALNTISTTDGGGTVSATITGFLESEVDGSITNEAQTLSVSGTALPCVFEEIVKLDV